MDDLAQKLTELLDSPEGLEKMKGMAEMLLGSADPAPAPTEPSPPPPKAAAPAVTPFPGLAPNELQTMMRMAKAFQSIPKEDSRTNLLLALKPHLSEPRQAKVDEAIKLLKVVSMMPILREQGLF